jgi:hypothetical protein
MALMKTYKCPKKCEPAKGISNDSVFIRGKIEWQDSFIKKLSKFPDIKVFKAEGEIDYEWDVDTMLQSDIVVFNFKGFSSKEILNNLFLLLLPAYIRFKPEVLIYIDGRNSAKKTIIELKEKLLSAEFEVFDKLEELEKKVSILFSYLKENQDASKVCEKQ